MDAGTVGCARVCAGSGCARDLIDAQADQVSCTSAALSLGVKRELGAAARGRSDAFGPERAPCVSCRWLWVAWVVRVRTGTADVPLQPSTRLCLWFSVGRVRSLVVGVESSGHRAAFRARKQGREAPNMLYLGYLMDVEHLLGRIS